MENLIKSISSIIRRFNRDFPKIKSAAYDALAIATDAKTTKMNAKNPVGTGSFSMNQRPGTEMGECSHAEGYYTTASGTYSHAEGHDTTASGAYSHAEGYCTTASGFYSHAEGYYTTASDSYSHAEGFKTTASGVGSHAEGHDTTTSGAYSHAEGRDTYARHNASHTEGWGTITGGAYQHVQGSYNIVDTGSNNINQPGYNGKYLHIVGNGTENKRSNAHTLDWDGNAWYQGTVEGTAIIVKSSTENSSKRFKITVDDSGTISATEVTE